MCALENAVDPNANTNIQVERGARKHFPEKCLSTWFSILNLSFLVTCASHIKKNADQKTLLYVAAFALSAQCLFFTYLHLFSYFFFTVLCEVLLLRLCGRRVMHFIVLQYIAII